MIDTSVEANLRTLGSLSFAVGVPGSAFVGKYLYDNYYAATSLQAVEYLLPIGGILICISLLLAPAAYKAILVRINYWIQTGERIAIREPKSPEIRKLIMYVSLTRIVRIIFLCAHPTFAIILVAGLVL